MYSAKSTLRGRALYKSVIIVIVSIISMTRNSDFGSDQPFRYESMMSMEV